MREKYAENIEKCLPFHEHGENGNFDDKLVNMKSNGDRDGTLFI